MKLIFPIICMVFICHIAFSQNIGIGTTSPDTSAQLDVSSSAKGILIPRMTAAQRSAIGAPAQGLLVYQTDGVVGFYVNRSTIGTFPNWSLISEGANYWRVSNTGVNNISNANTGRVGVGTFNPLMKLSVNHTDSAIALFNNSQTLASDVQSNIYFRNGNDIAGYYTGSVGTIGTSANTARLGLFAGAATTGSGLVEKMSIDNNGNVGIGTTTPSLAGLVVNTKSGNTNAVFGDDVAGVAIESTNPGIGLNSYYNNGRKVIYRGYGGLIGQDALTGRFYISTATSPVNGQGSSMTLADRLVISANGNVGIQGNTAPASALSFANSGGDKINLYQEAAGQIYGMGIGTGTMQIFSPATRNIAFGTGSSAAFTQTMGLDAAGSLFIQGTNAGYIFKDRTDTTYGGWNWYANAGKANLYRYTTGGIAMTIDANGKVGLQGNTSPTSALSFAKTGGDKINLYQESAGQMYGLGIGTGTMQIFSPATSNIAFGTGSSAAFTQTMGLDAAGSLFIQGTNAGYIFKDRTDNTYGGWNWYASAGKANLYRYTTGGIAMSVDAGGNVGFQSNVGLQGNMTPASPLSFSNSGGDKINLYQESAGQIYGMGIGTGTMQIFSPASRSISFGTGSSAAFTQTMGLGSTGSVFIQGADAGYIFKDRTNNSYGGWSWYANGGKASLYRYTSGGDIMTFDAAGNVMIGTNTGANGYKLSVNGKMVAEEVRVALKANWPDYVFAKNYQLLSLQNLEKFIDKNKHLPNVPAASEVGKDGILLGDMNGKLLEKIEEMSLYIIQLNKKLDAQQKEIDLLKAK